MVSVEFGRFSGGIVNHFTFEICLNIKDHQKAPDGILKNLFVLSFLQFFDNTLEMPAVELQEAADLQLDLQGDS